MDLVAAKDRLLRAQAESLSRLLNKQSDTIAGAQVLRILNLCRELYDSNRMRHGEYRRAMENFENMSAPETCGSIKKIAQSATHQNSAIRTLNSVLRRLYFYPTLSFGNPYELAWESVAVTGAMAQTVASGTAVQFILTLTASGQLDRVRKCECGRWFFALNKKKVFCCNLCRVQNFKRRDPEAHKNKQAKYMREYRKNPKVKGRLVSGKTKTRKQ